MTPIEQDQHRRAATATRPPSIIGRETWKPVASTGTSLVGGRRRGEQPASATVTNAVSVSVSPPTSTDTDERALGLPVKPSGGSR